MRLYLAGMLDVARPIYGLIAAENETEAIQKAEEKLNLRALPIQAREISEVDGFLVRLKHPGKGGEVVGKAKDEKPRAIERGRTNQTRRR